MRTALLSLAVFALAANCGKGGPPVQAQSTSASSTTAYLGFDRNEYPGDGNLAALRRTFSYTGYWLNNPPRARTNTWLGNRKAVEAAGFGFLILFNGRLDTDLKKAPDPSTLGKSDAVEAAATARQDGFPVGAVIFLDQEEGGRMLPEQRAYIHAWVDGVNASGFHAGIYCPGIAAPAGNGVAVATAEDIQQNAGERKMVFWVANDACPPSPGCAFPKQAPPPTLSGVPFADVWQFAQSPKRRDVAAGCPPNYDPDGSCYPPGVARETHLFVDLNTASSNDPSGGRSGAR